MKSMVKRRRSFNPSFCYATQRMRRREQNRPAGARRRSRSEMARLVEASGGSRILDLIQIQAQSATRSRSRAPRAITDLSRLAGGPEETKTL
ncbi:hypothetical protein Bca101_051966 [Brassica carinata]